MKPDPSPSPREGVGKLTRAQVKALEWFSVRGSASLFGRGDPTLSMVRKLHGLSLLESRAPARGDWGAFLEYSITAAGRAALARLDTEKGEAS